MTRFSPAGAALLGLLDTAAADGHTVLPVGLAGSVLGGRRLRLEDAVQEVGPAGAGLVSAPTAELIGLRRLVTAEEAIAAAVRARAGTGRLQLVDGPAGAQRDSTARGLGGANAAVADDAGYLDVETLAAFFAACDDAEPVVLAGDLADLPSPGPGDAFADIAGSGLAAVEVVTPREEGAGRAADAGSSASGSVLASVAASVRRGELPPVDDPTHEVVLVPAADAAHALHRVGQLVGDSIPRAVGVAPDEIQVLTVTEGGPCGRAVLASLLAQPPLDRAGVRPPLTVHTAAGRRFPAVVVVFGPDSAGLLNRPLVHSALTRATRHLSIVHAVGAALAHAVATVPRRPRRTLLPTLLK